MGKSIALWCVSKVYGPILKRGLGSGLALGLCHIHWTSGRCNFYANSVFIHRIFRPFSTSGGGAAAPAVDGAVLLALVVYGWLCAWHVLFARIYMYTLILAHKSPSIHCHTHYCVNAHFDRSDWAAHLIACPLARTHVVPPSNSIETTTTTTTTNFTFTCRHANCRSYWPPH